MGEPAMGGFVGRETEMRELCARLDSTMAGRGGMVLIEGATGIGKTRLILETARDARERGAVVLMGRGWEGGGAPVYWPWTQAIRSYLEGGDVTSLARELGRDADVLARLVPAFAEHAEEPRGGVSGDSHDAKFRLFAAVARLLARASADAPVLVALDDMHSADAPSVELLRYLEQELPLMRVFVVCAYRRLGADTAAADALPELARKVPRIRLRGLSADDVGVLMQTSWSVLPDEHAVSRMYEVTDGNPLFVHQVLELLDETGGSRESALAGPVPVPTELQHSIRHRLDGLRVDATEVLRVASVIGREFDVATLLEATGRPLEMLLELLDEGTRAGVIAETPASPGQFEFSHALLRRALYDDLGSAGRRRCHQAVGEALERVVGDDPGPKVAQLARHFAQAASGGQADKAIEYGIRHGRLAMDLGAYDEAVDAFDRAFGLLGLAPQSASRRIELLLNIGQARLHSGDAKGRTTFLEAARLARTSGTPELFARAALGLSELGVVFGQVDDEAISLLTDALGRLGPDGDASLRAEVLARLGAQYRYSDAPGREHELLAESVSVARSTNDPWTLERVLVPLIWVLTGPDDAAELAEGLEELERLTGPRDDPLIEVSPHIRRVVAALEHGDARSYDAHLESVARIAEQSRMPTIRWTAQTLRAGRELMRGRFDAGKKLSDEALSLGLSIGQANAGIVFGAQNLILSREHRLASPLRRMAADLAERYPRWKTWPLIVGWIDRIGERLDDAEQTYRQLAADGFDTFRRDSNWLLSMAMLAEVAEAFGTEAELRQLYEIIRPYGDRCASMGTGTAFFGPLAFGLGLLATKLQDWAGAQGHFERAQSICLRLGAEPGLAHAYRGNATMYHARGDAERARELYFEAYRRYRALGMDGWGEEMLERLEESAPASRAKVSAEQASVNEFRREGDSWRVTFAGSSAVLRDMKGFHYLYALLSQPRREFHVLDLVQSVDGVAAAPSRRATATEAGMSTGAPAEALLDAEARDAYRTRVEALREEIDEAETFGDDERRARAQAELDAIAAELARATGLGGRDRRMASEAERARINVTRTIRAAIDRIAQNSPTLARHLSAAIRTGNFCAYEPDPEHPVTWSL